MRGPELITIDVNSGKESSPPTKLVEFPADVLERFAEILKREVVPYGALDITLRTVALSHRAQKKVGFTPFLLLRGRHRCLASPPARNSHAYRHLIARYFWCHHHCPEIRGVRTHNHCSRHQSGFR
jgi:hypothetical protein